MPDTPVTPTPIDDRLTPTSRLVYEGTAESTMPFFKGSNDPADSVTPRVDLPGRYDDSPRYGPADDLGFDRPLFAATADDPATQEAQLPEYRVFVAATRTPALSSLTELEVVDEQPTQPVELQEELIPTPPWPVDALPQETLFDPPAPGTDTCPSPHLPPVYGFTTGPTSARSLRRRRWPWWIAGGVAITAAGLVATGLWSRHQLVDRARVDTSVHVVARAPRADPGTRRRAAPEAPSYRPVDDPAQSRGTTPSGRARPRQAPTPAQQVGALMARKQWAAAARALRELPRSRRRRDVQLQLWRAEILHRTGRLEAARKAYAALVGRGRRLGRRQRIEALIGLSEVLLKRNYRTASRSNARRALRLLGDDELGGMKRRAELQLQRCEVALRR